MNSELVSTKIPDHWLSLLIDTAHKEGVTKSSLVRKAIGLYLGLSEVDHTLVTVDLRSELDDIKTRLSAIERSTDGSTHTSTKRSTDMSTKVSTNGSTNSTPKPIATVFKASSPPTPKPIEPTLLTISELQRALGEIEFKIGKQWLGKRLNKAFKDGKQLPTDLAAVGVRADWDIKKKGKPSNPYLRWLWLERP